MARKVTMNARHLADRDNLYSKSHSHHISLGRWKHDGTEELACQDKSCAPPPVGTGGSKAKGGGGVDKSAGYDNPQENVQGSPKARAARDSYMGSGSRSEEDWDSIRANPDLRGRMYDAYNALPSYDKGAEKAYRDLATEVEAQFDHLTKSGIKVEFVDYDPYTNATQMRNDVEAGSIRVMKTDVTGSHPFFTDEQNDKFRAVHDVFGHASTGRGFDRHGERSAYISHKEMFKSPDAVRALASETEGQNAVATLTGKFGEQKVALMPDDLVFDTRLASAGPQTRLDGMARVVSKHALEFACRSAACRPPTSGGTGGSSKSKTAGSGLSAAQEKALKWAESPTRAGMPHPNVVRSLEARGLIERDPATLKFRQTDKGRAALGGGSSTGDRFDDEVEYEQNARAKLKAEQAATPHIVNAWESPHFKTRTAEEVGAMSEADAIKLIQDNDATGRRILEKGVQIRDTQPVGVRANLNVKKTTGITVQTMHQGSSEQLRNGTGMFGGEAIGYGAAPILKNANFSVNQNARAAIASGEKNKFPMASVDGNFQSPTTPNGQRDQQSKFNGVEITFNPMKTHLFVDPDGRAVKGATDVTVVGSKVYARGRIEYYTEANMPKPARDIPSEAHP